MQEPIDYARAAELLRLNSGRWVELRRDQHNRIYAVLSKWRRLPPVPFRGGRFEFRARSCGHGTGQTRLLARHMPVTIPIDTRPPTHA